MELNPQRSDVNRPGNYQIGNVGNRAIVLQGDHLLIGATAAELAVEVITAYQCGVDKSAAEVRELSGKLGIAESAIAGFFETMHEADVPLQQVAAKFENLALRYQSLLDGVRTLQSDDPEVQQLKSDAAAVIECGSAFYDRAEELLKQAEMIDRQATGHLAAALEKRSGRRDYATVTFGNTSPIPSGLCECAL